MPRAVQKARKSTGPRKTPTGPSNPDSQARYYATQPGPSTSGKPIVSQGKGRGGARGSPSSPRKRRHRPGQRALQEIRKYQSSTNLLLRRLPFARLVREVGMKVSPGRMKDFCWQAQAILCLQEAAEAYLVRLFEDALLCCTHAKRVTLQIKDMWLALRIGGYMQPLSVLR